MRDTTRRPLLLVLLVVSALLAVWLITRGVGTEPAQRHTTSTSPSVSATDPLSGLPWIAESALPPEARDTLALIAAGGPFPYPRNDNQTFQNREGLLPRERRGYYKEFTVETPGEGDRGPRRIVTGAGGEKYWTEDHYASFERIREGT